MKRRDFSLGLSAALTAGALVLPAAQAQTTVPAQLQGKKPELGTDYLKLDKPAAVEAPAGKIEVVEFFWY
ncbi:MAG: thiol:disulfide interchange protein DsbA/DsbL, partial [Rhodoferax sp.]